MTLPQAYYIEYILVTGEAYDSAARGSNLANPLKTEGEDCSTADNLAWINVNAYASNTSDYSGCCDDYVNLCGEVASSSVSSINQPNYNTATEMLEMIKMGGTAECLNTGKT